MDSFNSMSAILGSRHPILVPAFPHNTATSSETPTPPSIVPSNTPPVALSRGRRKSSYVFKSPSAEEPGGQWEAHTATRKRATPPYSRVAPRRASTDTDTTRSSSSSSSIPVAVSHNTPFLPLYHPLGTLAQSLPKLDPGLFGLPGSLHVDEPDEQADGDSGRSTSRARRVAPKAHETVDDESQSTGTPNGTGKGAPDASSRERNTSPRKRRGGGGAKRKRKEADDGDGIFPPPAKRTRNPRGAAANSVPAAPSPLVGPAVVASDLVDVAPENTGEGEEEAREEVQAPKRSSRARKPRRPAKRRDSSSGASTATSVSVSIAATTKAAAQAKSNTIRSAPEDEPPLLTEVANGVVDKRKEERTEDVTVLHVGGGKDPVQEVAAPPPEADKAAPDAPRVVEVFQVGPIDAVMNGVAPPPVTVVSAIPALPPRPEKEEREEGELSDD